MNKKRLVKHHINPCTDVWSIYNNEMYKGIGFTMFQITDSPAKSGKKVEVEYVQTFIAVS